MGYFSFFFTDHSHHCNCVASIVNSWSYLYKFFLKSNDFYETNDQVKHTCNFFSIRANVSGIFFWNIFSKNSGMGELRVY